MNLQNYVYLLLQKGCNNTLGFFLIQQKRMLQHPRFLFGTTYKDAPRPWVFSCYNRKGCYDTLCRLIVFPSASLPPWTDFYQSVVHFLESFISNLRDKFFPSIIMLINTLMHPVDASLHLKNVPFLYYSLLNMILTISN